MNNTSIARLSMPSGQGRGREYSVSSIGQRLGEAGGGVGYERTGWDGRTGALKPLSILFARDVELDLEGVAHARIEARAGRGAGLVCGGSFPAVLGRRRYPVETPFHSPAKLALKGSGCVGGKQRVKEASMLEGVGC